MYSQLGEIWTQHSWRSGNNVLSLAFFLHEKNILIFKESMITYDGRSSKIRAVVESGSNSHCLRLVAWGTGLHTFPVRASYS